MIVDVADLRNHHSTTTPKEDPSRLSGGPTILWDQPTQGIPPCGGSATAIAKWAAILSSSTIASFHIVLWDIPLI